MVGRRRRPRAAPPPVPERLWRELREYARALGVDVTLDRPARHYSPPRVAIGIHLHLFAIPIRPRPLPGWIRVPEIEIASAFGLPLAPGRRRAFAPDRRGGRGAILSDADGIPMAEVKGLNVYVPFDLLGQEPALASLLARRILDLTMPRLVPGLARGAPPRMRGLEAAAVALRAGTAAQEVGYRIAQRLPLPLEAWGEPVGPGTDPPSLEATVRGMAGIERVLGDRARRLAALQARHPASEEDGHEFDRLVRLPDVRHVEVRQGVVRVYTELVFCTFEGRRYRLGAYCLDYDLRGEARVWNLTDRIDAYDHPHVRDGQPCLGNVRDWVEELVADRQFAGATQVLMAYLRTVNPADWQRPIGLWRSEPA